MRRFVLAFVSLLLAVPAWADCSLVIRSFAVTSAAQTNAPIMLQWSYGQNMAGVTQTLSGDDFGTIALGGAQFYSIYTPAKPGQRSATLSVSNDTCTTSKTITYRIEHCPAAVPVITVDRTAVQSGGVINASVPLSPGTSATWTVRNGTPSATTGPAISVVAGAAGSNVVISVAVSRGAACARTAAVEIPVESAVNNFSCVGRQRTARVLSAIPAGAEVVWTLDNGTIDSGQGTGVITLTPGTSGP